VALKHDTKLQFPHGLMDRLDSTMKRLEMVDAWNHGALWEALAIEAELAHSPGHPRDEALWEDLGLHDDAFQRALSIVLPLKVFFRSMVATSCDWVRLPAGLLQLTGPADSARDCPCGLHATSCGCMPALHPDGRFYL
jgi:hypothetical protein